MKLYSVYYIQQYEELSILRNIDLANRAARAAIPVKEIKKLIHKDKQKLILMIMDQEKTLFDKEDGTTSKTVAGTVAETVAGTVAETAAETAAGTVAGRQYKPRYVSGYSDPLMSYSGF